MSLKRINKDLAIIKSGWCGNSLNKKGLYANLYGDDIKNFREVFNWFTSTKPMANLKINQLSPLGWQKIEDLRDKNTNSIIPIGHSCFIIDINGSRLLIDPVISNNRFLRRYTQVPFEISELNNVDYILLSHNHRDHIDKNSMINICKNNSSAIILTGLEIGRLLKRWGIINEIQEAGWYQQYNISEDFTIDFLPTQHWSRRWLLDTNHSLWGSFMINNKKSKKSIYFAGDGGYGQHFKDFGNQYNIDIAMIGIGAYEPQWFMKSAHTGSNDAVMVFHDLKAKYWIPMHYGTFDLSDEPIYYPEQVLRENYKEELKSIIWMHIGKRIIL